MEKSDELDVYVDEIFKGPDNGSIEKGIEKQNPSVLDAVDVDFCNDMAGGAGYDKFKDTDRRITLKAKKDNKAIKTSPIYHPPSKVLNSQIGIGINLIPGSPLNKAIANPTENDNLLSVIRANKPANTILKAIMEEIAEEAAYIKAWRNENWNLGDDISDATFKRIRMLKSLVETIVEQEKLKKDSVTGKVDFHGEAFQKVLKFFLETIQKTFRKVNIPAQYEDIFFPELAKSFDNFEKSAERIYYGKD